MNYYLIIERKKHVFEDLVKEYLSEGWKLYGAPIVIHYPNQDNDFLYCQAVILNYEVS